MAKLRVPAVAFGPLLFIAAGLAGVLAFLAFVVAGGRSAGLLWAVLVFLAVLTAWVAVAVLRGGNRSQAEQP